MEKMQRYWIFFLNSDYWAYSVFFFIFIGLTCFIAAYDRWDVFPTFSVAFLALIFSYHAYKFSKEKFRLDLLDKRLAVYEKFLKLLRKSFQTNRLNKEDFYDLFELHKEFIINYLPQIKFLFGNEILILFEKFQKSHIWLEVYTTPKNMDGDNKTWAEQNRTHRQTLSQLISTLSEDFRPYLYFGDFKK